VLPFNDFDKQFDRDFRLARRFAVGCFVFVCIVIVAIGFVAYKVLSHFGIL